MPKSEKNKMVNRAPVAAWKGKLHSRQSGAYGKGEPEKGKRRSAEKAKAAGNGQAPVFEVPQGKVNNINPDLKDKVVDIAKLTLDPDNARLHPERNLQAIKDSLNLYGQRKPIVVRRQGMVVVAGNGTLEAARALGWTKIAASVQAMTNIEAAGYGLADNRTAELARWNFETVAKLDKLLQEQEHASVGWSADELEVLRAADWTPPEVDNTTYNQGEGSKHTCPECGYEWS